VKQIQPGEQNHKIIETIATLGHQLELDVIAEGIETPTQLEQLQRLGYKFGQGYLFAKPLSQAEIERLLSCNNLYFHLY